MTGPTGPNGSDRPPPRERNDLADYAGAGLEFFAAVALFVLAGWWLGGRFGGQAWWIVGGLAIGFAAGLYRLVRSAGRRRGP